MKRVTDDIQRKGDAMYRYILFDLDGTLTDLGKRQDLSVQIHRSSAERVV